MWKHSLLQILTLQNAGVILIIRSRTPKSNNRIGPKTDPWGTRDNTGTGYEA